MLTPKIKVIQFQYFNNKFEGGSNIHINTVFYNVLAMSRFLLINSKKLPNNIGISVYKW